MLSITKTDDSSAKYEKIKNPNFSFFEPVSKISLPQFQIPADLKLIVFKNLKKFPNMSEASKQYLNLLEKIKNGIDLNENNYLQIWKLMLYLEEIQQIIDIQKYDKNNVSLERMHKSKPFFKLYLENLLEMRPSVRPNDLIEIRHVNTKSLYLSRVLNVMDKYVILVSGSRFVKVYSSKNLYNIRFRASNYTARCCHFGLYLLNEYQLTPHLFPSQRVKFNKKSYNDFWFNKSIENNPEQKQAVTNILYKASYPAPYILYGPPGTGKTSTVVEAICQIWQNNPSNHILVCTPSNSAADVITKRLLKFIPSNNMYRMYSPSQEGFHIDPEIICCSNYVDGEIMMLPKILAGQKNIIICTLCASTRLLFLDFKENHFSHVFIDEAGQATEPDALLPFNLLSSVKEGRIGILHAQVILSGDPQQLGPSIRSKLAEPILGISMLERLMECDPYKKTENNEYNSNYITKLVRNYRSHPLIIQVPNELFYENELQACGDKNIKIAEDWDELVKKKFPLIFHGVKGDEIKDHKTPSLYNSNEVKVVIDYVKLLLGKKFKNRLVTKNDIGIITPFCAQRDKIHKALQEHNIHNLDVGTVEFFQGREKNIIILSTVRSVTFLHDKKYHIGFLSNRKRFNVALTRARALLIVIGNPTVLQIDKHWSYFLHFCKVNKVYRGTEFNTNSIENKLDKIFYKSGSKKTFLPLKNDDDLKILKIDKGIMEKSDDSEVDEPIKEVLPSTKPNLFNNCYNSYNKQSYSKPQRILSDVIDIKRESEVKFEKKNAKQQKKQRKQRKQKIKVDYTETALS